MALVGFEAAVGIDVDEKGHMAIVKPECGNRDLAARSRMSRLCYIFRLMPDNKRLLDLALKGLEAERSGLIRRSMN
jgi:hypothetical protein